MEKKLWYAIMKDNEDTDWGTGSFSLNEATAVVRGLQANGFEESYIAVIDANYDANGKPTTDDEWVKERRGIAA